MGLAVKACLQAVVFNEIRDVRYDKLGTLPICHRCMMQNIVQR